jgi:hypothetical protein
MIEVISVTPKLKQYSFKGEIKIANSPKQALRAFGFKFDTKPFQSWQYLRVFPSSGPVEKILVYGPRHAGRLLERPTADELFKPDYVIDCLGYI